NEMLRLHGRTPSGNTMPSRTKHGFGQRFSIFLKSISGKPLWHTFPVGSGREIISGRVGGSRTIRIRPRPAATNRVRWPKTGALMSDDASVELQALIDRAGAGDRAARSQLLERACDRLRRLAARIFHKSFPALRNRHELDSVVHETWLRLAQALETANPPTVADFFRLAAHKIRQVLLDMADPQRRLPVREAAGVHDLRGRAPGGEVRPRPAGRVDRVPPTSG